MKNATGSFQAALIGSSVISLVLAGYQLYVRARVMSGRRARAIAVLV